MKPRRPGWRERWQQPHLSSPAERSEGKGTQDSKTRALSLWIPSVNDSFGRICTPGTVQPAAGHAIVPAMPQTATSETLNHAQAVELKRLYDSFSIAVERASATMHIKGMESDAFHVEDAKCAAIWNRIRGLMGPPRY